MPWSVGWSMRALMTNCIPKAHTICFSFPIAIYLPCIYRACNRRCRTYPQPSRHFFFFVSLASLLFPRPMLLMPNSVFGVFVRRVRAACNGASFCGLAVIFEELARYTRRPPGNVSGRPCSRPSRFCVNIPHTRGDKKIISTCCRGSSRIMPYPNP